MCKCHLQMSHMHPENHKHSRPGFSLEGIPIDRGKYREKTPGKLLPDVQRILSAEAPSGSGSKAIDV